MQFLTVVLMSVGIAGGCSGPAEPMSTAEATVASSAPESQGPTKATPPATEYIKVSDPVENAYTVDMPKGWHYRTYSVRMYDIHSMVDIMVSPDGSVLLWGGDPSMPQYWTPEQAHEITYQMAANHPGMEVKAYVPADHFIRPYIQRKFGQLEAFKLTSSGLDEEGTRHLQKKFDEAGAQIKTSVARADFTYKDAGKNMNARVHVTTSNMGFGWSVYVYGVTTTGNPDDYTQMFSRVGTSRKMNPQWIARRDQLHQEQMAQIERFGQSLRDQHARSMAALQTSARLHQQRMSAIQAQGDASMKAYYDRMNSGDVQHRNFLNYINEENTVVNSSGKTYQVAGNYQRYFMHKNEPNRYYGGHAHMSLEELRKLGLNPDDYEEVKIRK